MVSSGRSLLEPDMASLFSGISCDLLPSHCVRKASCRKASLAKFVRSDGDPFGWNVACRSADGRRVERKRLQHWQCRRFTHCEYCHLCAFTEESADTSLLGDVGNVVGASLFAFAVGAQSLAISLL